MFYAKLAVGILVIYLASEIAPGLVNGALILVLVGLLLAQSGRFAALAAWVSSITK